MKITQVSKLKCNNQGDRRTKSKSAMKQLEICKSTWENSNFEIKLRKMKIL